MSIQNGYATLAEIRLRLRMADTFTTDDTMLESMVEAASRQIDRVAGWRFYASSETRYYTAEWSDLLVIPEGLLSITTLKTLTANASGTRTYGHTWATTDYDLEPYNAQEFEEPEPYRVIRLNPQGQYTFPLDRRGVELAGSFGYCSAANQPKLIKEVCLRIAQRMYALRDAPLGSAKAGVGGFDSQLGGTRLVVRDEDVAEWLGSYVRPRIGAV